jgi:hypothetical protein
MQAKDKLFLSIGVLALALTSAWAFLEQSKISARGAVVNAPSGGAAYETQELKVSMPPSQSWAKASAQPAGDKWIYNVFTPPKIYYNINTKQFTVILPEIVTPPSPDDPLVPPPPPRPALELVSVTQPLFRLQLVGYIGTEGNYRGTFNNEITGKTFFGVSGRKVPELNLEIVAFEAKRRRVDVPGGSTLIEVTAYADVKDTLTGKVYRLDPNKRLPEGPLTATFRLLDGSEVTAKTGDTVKSAEFTYDIGVMTLDPPSVAVTKTGGPEAQPVQETLTIPLPVAPAPVAPELSGDAQPAPEDLFPGPR